MKIMIRIIELKMLFSCVICRIKNATINTDTTIPCFEFLKINATRHDKKVKAKRKKGIKG